MANTKKTTTKISTKKVDTKAKKANEEAIDEEKILEMMCNNELVVEDESNIYKYNEENHENEEFIEEEHEEKATVKQKNVNRYEYEEERVNLNDSFLVVNLCSFPVSYRRIALQGDEMFQANKAKPIQGKELEAQFLDNNVFYVGTEMGKHSRLQIKDKALVNHFIKLGYLSEDFMEYVLDEKRCKEIINAKDLREFQHMLDKYVVCKYEQRMFVDMCKKLVLNNYKYIKEIEKRFDVTYE